jgi:DNA polymerase IV
MLRALYVDFNSFFASVEQQLRPELRGQPIGVVAVKAETTCCIAASIEAKRYGVKTGTGVRDARKLCPNIKFVVSRPAAYIDMHHRLIAAVESCIHVEQVRSIDEMWCKLTGRDQQHERAIAIAHEIKRAIHEKVGTEMRSSIGLAPNRYLSKVASDMQKPDGLVLLDEHNLPQALYVLRLRDLNGIGHAMEERLMSMGIQSVAQLLAAPTTTFRNAWRGVEGERMLHKLRGDWHEDLPTEKSSLSHSHVLPPDLRNPDAAYAVLHRLVQKIAMRLRANGLATQVLQLKVKYVDGQRCKAEVSLSATQDTRVLLNVLDQKWPSLVLPKGKPMAVAVGLVGLQPAAARNLSLFESVEQATASDKLQAVMDTMNQRFGKQTVFFGGAYPAKLAAPMRIAFTHIPDVDLEGDE